MFRPFPRLSRHLSSPQFRSYSSTRHPDLTLPLNSILCIYYTRLHFAQIRIDPVQPFQSWPSSWSCFLNYQLHCLTHYETFISSDKMSKLAQPPFSELLTVRCNSHGRPDRHLGCGQETLCQNTTLALRFPTHSLFFHLSWSWTSSEPYTGVYIYFPTKIFYS